MNDINKIIGQPESETLEYKAILPPSRNLAQLIASFANTNGGYIVLGVAETPDHKFRVNGLSADFNANAITHKAIDLLTPRPNVEYQYVLHQTKSLYVIKVEKSEQQKISIEGKIYIREGSLTKLLNPIEQSYKPIGYARIKTLSETFDTYRKNATNSKIQLIEHYQSVLKVIDDLSSILYPEKPKILTTNPEGKILTRILFSSCVDNFEKYLADLLYEIYLTKPDTLKSLDMPITIKEVLNCSDIQEFIKYVAEQKIGKLQKGSVKGFIDKNKQISGLNILNTYHQDEIERILQIRHLYSHRNGRVDEKFLKYFPSQFAINAEHQMSISEVCDKLNYLAEIAHKLDEAAIIKYGLDVL